MPLFNNEKLEIAVTVGTIVSSIVAVSVYFATEKGRLDATEKKADKNYEKIASYADLIKGIDHRTSGSLTFNDDLQVLKRDIQRAESSMANVDDDLKGIASSARAMATDISLNKQKIETLDSDIDQLYGRVDRSESQLSGQLTHQDAQFREEVRALHKAINEVQKQLLTQTNRINATIMEFQNENN